MAHERRALAYALTAVLLWSTVATAFKIALSYQSVLVLLTGATLVSALAIGALLLVQGRLGEAVVQLRDAPGQAMLLALLNPVLYYLVLFEAYDRLPAQVAQPVNYTWAITLALLSVPVLGHRLAVTDVAGLAVGYVGVAVISMAGREVTGSIDPLGLALALGSTLIWAGFWLANTRARGDPVVRLFLAFALASPVLLLLTWLLPGVEVDWSVPALLGVVYVGLFEMGFTFVLWQLALHATDNAARISSLIFVSPFISLLLIHYVLGEPLQWQTFAGLVLIIMGVMLAQRSRPRADVG
jgi:drug/metabolite transporter (DMT)-like permease